MQKSEAEISTSTSADGVGDRDFCLQPGYSLGGIKARQFAHHEKGIARLNNGSFGSCPATVQAVQAEWRAQWLKQPDDFVYHQLEDGLNASRAAVAEMIRASSVDEVVFLDNATTAMAILAQDLVWGFIDGRFKKGDAVLLINFAYEAVKKCFESVVARAGGRVIYAKIPFPITSPDMVLESYQESLKREALQMQASGSVIRLAVIDHITSMPAMTLPVREMVALARRHGVEQVLIDGAHALGSVELNVQEIDADYYTSNLHKWVFGPASAAFFHCKSCHLPRLHHPVVSNTHGKGLAAECAWVGTRDHTAQLAITAAVDFVNRLGGIDSLMRLNHDSVVAMGEMLAKEWGTKLGAPAEMVPAMIMVGIPPVLSIRSFEDGLELRTILRQEFQTEVPFHFVPEEDQSLADQTVQMPGISAYARVSHQIYNTLEEYHRLRDAIFSLVERRWTPSRNLT